MTISARDEIARGERFPFGRNWSRFLAALNDTRIQEAEASLRDLLGVRDLRAKSFLDVGSGSGLFSLAARRLGAVVTSFDFDPESVACTRELKRRYFPDDQDWRIGEGSALDARFMEGKGQFDVVYSWGVLHHTGNMWNALSNVALPVAPGGALVVALYNDQGAASRRWRRVKQIYCSSLLGKAAVCAAFFPLFFVRGALADVLRGVNPITRYRRSTTRGMSRVRDWFDWLGGLPFEVARPEEVLLFFRDRGFILTNLITAGGGSGNNQYVFVKA